MTDNAKSSLWILVHSAVITGLVIVSEGGSDGVDLTSRETGQGPLLNLTCI